MTNETETIEPQNGQTHAFQAETRQLLDIVIHSLYSNKEIFLRELISNSSDALDRLRFDSLTQSDLLESGEILEIRLDVDPVARTLSISDNGIGMSREEVIANLGTIAKSGTREILRQAQESGGDASQLSELIGQFGVGFYSTFMVADEVTVVTRRAGQEKATRWQSSGNGEYSLDDDRRFLRGTTVTLKLKAVDEDHGLEDYTKFDVLQRIVRRHSDFVSYPVRTKRVRQSPRLGDDGKPIPGSGAGETEEVTLNSMRPIWTRPEAEVTDEEHAEFYQHIAHDWNDPLDRLQLKAEGRIEYTALLYVPSKAPFDLFWRDQSVGVQLYVRRVLIQDRCEELLPSYLRFLRGVVDSADLQLNVSREMLQQDRHMTQMRRWITRKALDRFSELMKKDRPKYESFWSQFGRVLKEGLTSGGDNNDRLAELLLFQSSADESKLTSLAEYVARMPEGQAEIFYLTGDNRSVVQNAPQGEAFLEKGWEVLYLIDPVDEFLTQALTEFDGKTLRSVASTTDVPGENDEEDESKAEERKAREEDFGNLLSAMAGTLEDQVKSVRLSRRLRTSPACLVGEDGDMSPHLERLLRQTEMAGMTPPSRKRVLELNPEHPAVTRLHERFAANPKDPQVAESARLLYGYALLAEGSELPDIGEFNRLLSDLMARGF